MSDPLPDLTQASGGLFSLTGCSGSQEARRVNSCCLASRYPLPL